ncbi:PKD domain-containing protein [Halostella sp. PRR32]|uniref:PKD domain-containing protein n=1 Tax=Halostella sp. PRR32 TaxID=3098147 RepID=UPI002B1D2705|nr:PKD domain-containing protein [Halostella sp. PRR32]
MHSQTTRFASISLAMVLTTASFVALISGVPVAAANEGTASVVQDGDCRELTMYGDATESVSSYYDYRSHETDDVGVYSSYGTRELQRTGESQLFVYNGSERASLVFIHDRLGDGEGGGQINATLTDLPENGEWAVEDDDYPRRNDSFVRDGDASAVEWYWKENRTDGGAFRGVGPDGITVEAEFSDGVRGWTARDADGDHVDLSMDSSATIRTGGCDRASPSASLAASPGSVELGNEATFDASGSAGENIAEYRWDLTGDGAVDRTTAEPSTGYGYDTPGERTVTVTVVDGNGNQDTAETAVDVTDETAPTVAADVPDSGTAGETLTLSASESSDDHRVASVGWTFDGTESVTGEEITRTFDEAGSYSGTVTVSDPSGNTAEESFEISIEAGEDGGDGSDDDTGGDGGGDGSNGGGESGSDDDSDGSGPDGGNGDAGNGNQDDDGESPGGGGAAGSAPVSDTSGPPETTVETVRDGDSTRVTAQNVRAGEAVQFEPVGERRENRSVSVEFVPAESAESLNASVTTEAADGLRADSVPVTVSVSDGPAVEMESVTYSVQVDGESLERPADAALYQRTGNEWHRLNGTAADEPAEPYRFEATTGEFSSVALAVRRPNVSVTAIETGGELRADETNNVTATLRNEGTADATETVSVALDGENVTSRTVSVPANGTETVTVPVSPDETGEATLSVNDESSPVAVVPAETGGVVREATVTDQQVTAGTPVEVTATVSNDRDSALTRTVTFRTDDGPVATESVTVPANGSAEVTATVRFNRTGTYEITAGEAAERTATATVRVEEAESGEEPPNATSESNGMSGFGVGVALIAVCLSGFVAVRRLT